MADEGSQQVFQAVCLDFVHGGKAGAQGAVGVALVFEPDDVGFGQVQEEAAFVLAEGHAGVGEGDEIMVHKVF